MASNDTSEDNPKVDDGLENELDGSASLNTSLLHVYRKNFSYTFAPSQKGHALCLTSHHHFQYTPERWRCYYHCLHKLKYLQHSHLLY